MKNLLDLNGEVAVVIGAAGVLAGAIAEAFAEAGARVAVLDLNAEKGEERAQKINQGGGRARFFFCNVLERETLRKANEEVESALGAPTILLNGAGGNDPKTTVSDDNPFENIPLENWRRNFDLNLVGGALLPCQVFGPGMVARKRGSIINIASVSAHIPLSKVVSYSASKAAVLSLTRFLAREWARHGVRVNSITPGFFPAEQNRRLLFNEDGTPNARTQAVWNHTPMGRFGEAQELLGAALFLASSKASSFVTGADIRVDGGFLAQTI
ncbi:MAG TPA: SDR family oxidoreductase [Candidatus Paceibacterota bacterium]|nr:SDR family oxidoreductase [Verrucomicrobiota bacterium]HOX02398.1 SDR family oxidoreductase [Verrucomicrobiota bacterium]HRZ45152.1 SDR family oxidoreductase [Candidatus Paceibacterota bacterium]HRZ92812.1 SDR family oxidoreductase [Candidatus Paceibacterota bacterium]